MSHLKPGDHVLVRRNGVAEYGTVEKVILMPKWITELDHDYNRIKVRLARGGFTDVPEEDVEEIA